MKKIVCLCVFLGLAFSLVSAGENQIDEGKPVHTFTYGKLSCEDFLHIDESEKLLVSEWLSGFLTATGLADHNGCKFYSKLYVESFYLTVVKYCESNLNDSLVESAS